MKILLPIDGSDCSNSVIDWVMQTFDHQTTQYCLLYVLEIIPEEALLIESEKAQALSMLKQVKTKLEQAGCTVLASECIVEGPLPSLGHEICQFAAKMKIDQIVIGSHGRHGLSKLLMGSVSEKVLEHCQCQVTVYREKPPS